MRTTLDIDDDVLAAARELAAVRKTTAGAVISGLAREALLHGRQPGVRTRNGFPLLPGNGDVPITPNLVNLLLDDEELGSTS